MSVSEAQKVCEEVAAPILFRELTFGDAKKIALDYLGQTSFYGMFSRKDIYHEAFEGHILKLLGIKRDWRSTAQWDQICIAHRSACKAQEILFGDAECPHSEKVCDNCICLGRMWKK